MDTHRFMARRRLGGAGKSGGFFFLVLGLFNLHVAKFVGVKDLSAVQALDKFDVVLARHHADLGVLTDRIHG